MNENDTLICEIILHRKINGKGSYIGRLMRRQFEEFNIDDNCFILLIVNDRITIHKQNIKDLIILEASEYFLS